MTISYYYDMVATALVDQDFNNEIHRTTSGEKISYVFCINLLIILQYLPTKWMRLVKTEDDIITDDFSFKWWNNGKICFSSVDIGFGEIHNNVVLVSN